ncbi:MAG: hypothetical protein ACLQDQ_04400 [Myxococcaceae bacterium]
MTRVFIPFAAGMVALGALGFGLSAAWPESASDARLGVLLAVLSGLGGLLVKSQALRKGVNGALGWTVALFFARVLLWGAGVLWLRSHAGNAVAFTAGFCTVFGLGLLLEVSFLLVASRRRARGAA